MGMTIDESMNQIIDSLMGKKANLLNHSDRVALTDALNTMRKYQKIKEQVDIAIDKENFAISDARLIQIREFIDGNNDNRIDELNNLEEPLDNEIASLVRLLNQVEEEPFINKPCVSSEACEHDKQMVLDKIRAEITDCLKALDEIERSGLNIYLPNEISGRRLTYQQCLRIIDKHKAESEE